MPGRCSWKERETELSKEKADQPVYLQRRPQTLPVDLLSSVGLIKLPFMETTDWAFCTPS